MNIIIERAALLRSLGHVQSVVERRNTIPILSNVLLKASDGELSLAATDVDLEIVETVPATVTRAGGTTAPAHTLYDIVRKLPDGSQVELDIGGDGTILTLRAGRSQFKLSCLPVEDFPQLSGGDLAHRFDLAANDLRALVDRTRFAISTEETRYYLNGIYLHAAKAKTGGAELPVLRAVATDGHRLARVEMPLPDGAANIPGVIVPRKTVTEIRKLIDEAADRIELSLSDNVEDLLQREADIAVRMVAPSQDALLARRLGDIKLGLYAHKGYLERHGTPHTLPDLADHRLIGFDRPLPYIRAMLKKTPELKGVRFAFRSDSNLAQLAAIRSGNGIGTCQTGIARRDPDLVRLLREDFELPMETWLAMHENLKTSPRCRVTFDALASGLANYIRQAADHA